MKIAVVGTAGRKDDADKLSIKTWQSMLNNLVNILNKLPQLNTGIPINIELVSGGAAWADHLAVHLFLNQKHFALNNPISKLTLHLPAKFEGSYQVNTDNNAARIANYYHECFSNCTGVDSLSELQLVLEHPDCTVTVSKGFHARNLLVGQVDILIAYTFGTSTDIVYNKEEGWFNHAIAGVKPGGTAHTWDNSKAGTKIHINLSNF